MRGMSLPFLSLFIVLLFFFLWWRARNHPTWSTWFHLCLFFFWKKKRPLVSFLIWSSVQPSIQLGIERVYFGSGSVTVSQLRTLTLPIITVYQVHVLMFFRGAHLLVIVGIWVEHNVEGKIYFSFRFMLNSYALTLC